MKVLYALCVIAALMTAAVCSAAAPEFDWRAAHAQAESLTAGDAARLAAGTDEGPAGLYRAGLFYLRTYQLDAAQDVFQQILARGDRPEARWGLAEIAKCRHHYEESAAATKRVIEERPGFAPAYLTMAHLRYLQLDFTGAVEWAGKVINMRPNVDHRNLIYAHGLYAAARGALALRAGPVSGTINGLASLRHLRIIRNLDADCFVTHFGWGSFYALAPVAVGGSLDKAEASLKRALEIEPYFPDAYVRLAQIYRKKGDTELYELYLNKALEMDPQNELAADVRTGACEFFCLQ